MFGRNSMRHALALAALLLVSSAAITQAADSLYKRLGGYDAIAAVTDDFIGRLVADPGINKFFVHHSTDALNRTRQLAVDMICWASGGPCLYIGRDMKTAHAGLGITEADWNTSVTLFVATLDKFKVPEQEKSELLAIVGGLKAQVVDQK